MLVYHRDSIDLIRPVNLRVFSQAHRAIGLIVWIVGVGVPWRQHYFTKSVDCCVLVPGILCGDEIISSTAHSEILQWSCQRHIFRYCHDFSRAWSVIVFMWWLLQRHEVRYCHNNFTFANKCDSVMIVSKACSVTVQRLCPRHVVQNRYDCVTGA